VTDFVVDPPDDLLYLAWGVIANAPGAWDDDTEWRRAAIRWRDQWHATLDDGSDDDAD